MLRCALKHSFAQAELLAAERKVKDLKANLNVSGLSKKKLQVKTTIPAVAACQRSFRVFFSQKIGSRWCPQERAEAALTEFVSGQGKLRYFSSFRFLSIFFFLLSLLPGIRDWVLPMAMWQSNCRGALQIMEQCEVH